MATAHDYHNEELLREELERHLDKLWFANQAFEYRLIKRESTCFEGRADVVWGAFTWRKVKRWTTAQCATLANPAAASIAVVLKELIETTADELAEHLSLSRAYVSSWLKQLADVGVVDRLHRSFALSNSFGFPKVELCAFECKLHHWKRAIWQAGRYWAFANRVLVVMPNQFIHRIPEAHLDAGRNGFIALKPRSPVCILREGSKDSPWRPAANVQAIAWLHL